MRYSVPIKYHQPKAKTKAEISYYMQSVGGGRYYPVKCGGAIIFEFEAKTHAEAARKLQELVKPGDKRLIKGRTQVKLWAVKGGAS